MIPSPNDSIANSTTDFAINFTTNHTNLLRFEAIRRTTPRKRLNSNLEKNLESSRQESGTKKKD
jgi:hypothetical protein